MHLAVVCDLCWYNLGVSWKMGLISLHGIADLFGVSFDAVKYRLSRIGFRSPLRAEGKRIRGKRHYQKVREEMKATMAARVKAYRQSERGRETMRRKDARYRQRKRVEREEMNARNVVA